MKANRLIAFLACLLLCFCQKSSVKPDEPLIDSPSTGAAAVPVAPGPPVPIFLAEPGAQSILARPITSSGENSNAHFSPDGQRILFVSRLRPNHKQAQVYELHLGRMTEKRVAFHDGDDADPLYLPDGQRFLFSSTTDEIKDEAHVIERTMKTYDPSAYEKRVKEKGPSTPGDQAYEIYVQSLHGRSIERLTKSDGLDADPDIDSKGKRILFSSSRSREGTHLFMMTGKHVRQLTSGKVRDRGARFSPDGRFVVWSRSPVDDSNESILMIAQDDFRKPRMLVDKPGLNVDPAWHPSGSEIMFSSTRDGRHFDLYIVDREGQCIRRLTQTDFDEIESAFSPDGSKVLFTGLRSGKQHIYIVDYKRPNQCWASTDATPPAIATPAPASSSSPGPNSSPMSTPAPATAPSSPLPSPSTSMPPSDVE